MINIRFSGPHWMNFLLSVGWGKLTLLRGLLVQGLFAICHRAEKNTIFTLSIGTPYLLTMLVLKFEHVHFAIC